MAQIIIDPAERQLVVEQIVTAVLEKLEKQVTDAVAKAMKGFERSAVEPDTAPSGPQDVEWGFRFGVDGVWKAERVREYLGIAERTLGRLVYENRVRVGTLAGGKERVFCVRALKIFIASCERGSSD